MRPGWRVLRCAMLGAFAFSVVAQAAEPPPGATSCTGCHAARADVVGPGPRLAGGQGDEMLKALDGFRSGQKPATVMDRIVRGFTRDELQAIVAWFAAQK
jgi:cytochrome c553